MKRLFFTAAFFTVMLLLAGTASSQALICASSPKYISDMSFKNNLLGGIKEDASLIDDILFRKSAIPSTRRLFSSQKKIS